MSDHKDQLRSYIDGLEKPVSVDEAMNHRAERRFRVPAAVLAGAAVVLIPALVLVGLRWLPGGGDEVAETSAPPVSTSSAVVETTSTTVETTTAEPEMIVVPDLIGLTEDQARAAVVDLGLEVEVTEQYASLSGFGLIASQWPEPDAEVDIGSTVLLGINRKAGCLDASTEPPAESDTITILLQCTSDMPFPAFSTPIYRTRDLAYGSIEATLRALLSGPSTAERASGFRSAFSAETADALNSVTREGSRLTVDFNDGIMFEEISTSHASTFFLAELQANLFQFSDVDSIVFERNGDCSAFWGMLESGCQIATRAQWEQTVAEWNSVNELQPGLEDALGIDDVVGKTFATQLHNDSQEIMTSRSDRFDSDLYYSGFSEVGGWLLDDATTDDLKNWALHVTGQNAEMIWLVESVGHTDEGSMIYTVRAVLEIPWREIEEVMQGDPFVRDGATACTRKDTFDPRLVVVAEVAETDGVISNYMNPLLAWLIDVDGASFVEIPTDGIACLFDLS